ncbi:MAG TPA: hypothetical protein VD993_01755 [Chitinophagaceae bacterium]|nr:hypothetical protein [Chitinophagaceae bacterium]
MKKIPVIAFHLSIICILCSATSPIQPAVLTKYKVFKFEANSHPIQPPLPCTIPGSAIFMAQDESEFDLEALNDPTPQDHGDELCEPSNQVCLVQFRFNNDVMDCTYSEILLGSLIE